MWKRVKSTGPGPAVNALARATLTKHQVATTQSHCELIYSQSDWQGALPLHPRSPIQLDCIQSALLVTIFKYVKTRFHVQTPDGVNVRAVQENRPTPHQHTPFRPVPRKQRARSKPKCVPALKRSA